MCDTHGVHSVREVPVSPTMKSTKRKNKKTGKQEVHYTKQFQWNYPSLIRMLRYARTYAHTFNRDLVVLYEDTNVIPFQGVTATVKQHIGIQMWPIACECLRIACESINSSQWKRQVGLKNDKQMSITRAKSVMRDTPAGMTHDLAEAILLGYYYTKHQGTDGWESPKSQKPQSSKSRRRK